MGAAKLSGGGNFVKKTGDTMTGDLIITAGDQRVPDRMRLPLPGYRETSGRPDSNQAADRRQGPGDPRSKHKDRRRCQEIPEEAGHEINLCQEVRT